MTLKELAAACGLSASAVSKALNGYADVGPETRAFVRAKAAELGYTPNAAARALKSGRTFALGVLFDDLAGGGLMHSFFGPVIDSFKKTAESLGYEITFIKNNSEKGGMSCLEHCRSRGFDGVCIVNVTENGNDVQELVRSDIPLVSIDYPYEGRCCIGSDNDVGIAKLTGYIISQGHTRVAFIAGEETNVTDARRMGFIGEMRRHGLEVRSEYLLKSRFHDPAAARSAVTKLLALDEPPTCILIQDDLSALGGMEAIRERGLRIPEDISIAGYDGVSLLQMCRPRLTTYAQNTEQMGYEAAIRLIGFIENPQSCTAAPVTVSGHLIKGDTVMRPANQPA